MLQSKLFAKTRKNISRDIKLNSHRFLIQGGFIEESVAGRYYFLPLGMRVRDKIIKIIEEEMNKSGAQKMITPVLHPLKLWRETNRNNEAGFELMTTEDRRGMKFVPGGTAEEMFVDLIRKYKLSYKDLPFNLYQFSQKFRDELRAKGGLLRVREFLMKDAYSFHTDEKDFEREYRKMAKVYLKIFKRLGLEAKVVESDNGYIGGDYCHEFVVESEAGESRFLISEDGEYCAHEDVAKFQRPKSSKSLKHIIYKHRISGAIIVALIRGDLQVNKTKLEKILDAVEQLEEAGEADLKKLRTKSGYAAPFGYKGVKYVADLSVKTVKDLECEIIDDIALAKEGYLTEDGRQKLIAKKGIEVGNIFQLGHHYTKKMKGAVFVDIDGKEKPYYMGCYGIGIGRNMAAIVEKYNDQNGIIWPEAVAPYKVHLIEIPSKNEQVKIKAQKLYKKLSSEGVEVLYDDRNEMRAGEKLADSDLIGSVFRVIISERNLLENKYELKKRSEDKSKLVTKEKLLKILA
ncbi:MAG: proline--tRNA ligase [Candidatus Moranbacteria bacterium]|nr:proline--tRNA ligase [Candidatus Moranbacteria bacterium]